MKQQLLCIEQAVTPADSKTNLFHTFAINQPFERLLLYFCYTPKEQTDQAAALCRIQEAMAVYAPAPYEKAYGRPEDYLPAVVNLLTLSLDDPSGYRGCAHRHDPIQQHVISQSDASPGFYPGALQTGLWRVGVNLHCVTTPQCTYTLQVFGERGED